jgi:hypothetical protein
MKILDYIFCDDIRFEIRSKYTLVGLYQDSINIETDNPSSIDWPIGLRFGILLRLHTGTDLPTDKETNFRFELKYNGEQVGSSEGAIAINDSKSAAISIPMGPFTVVINEPGAFTFRIHFTRDGKEVVHLESSTPFPVRLRQV